MKIIDREMTVKENHNELKPCPFCGGKAELHFQPIYTDEGVCVKCSACIARSKFIPFDCHYTYYRGQKNVFISKQRAVSDVIDLWNMRVQNDPSE